jgi:hypothetical protein
VTEPATAQVKQTLDTVTKAAEPAAAPVKQTVDTVTKAAEPAAAPVKQTVDTVTKAAEAATAPVLRTTEAVVAPVVDDVVRPTPVTTGGPETRTTTNTAKRAPVATRPASSAPRTPDAAPATRPPGGPTDPTAGATTTSADVRPVPATGPSDAHRTVAPAREAGVDRPMASAVSGAVLAGPQPTITARPQRPARAGRGGAPEPSAPTGGGSSNPSGMSGVAPPAPPGAVSYLLAAFSLAAALTFTRLLTAPARWRPVLFVSAIERPG